MEDLHIYGGAYMDVEGDSLPYPRLPTPHCRPHSDHVLPTHRLSRCTSGIPPIRLSWANTFLTHNPHTPFATLRQSPLKAHYSDPDTLTHLADPLTPYIYKVYSILYI